MRVCAYINLGLISLEALGGDLTHFPREEVHQLTCMMSFTPFRPSD